MMRRTLLTAGVVALAAAPSAAAQERASLAGGKTTLKVDHSVVRALQGAGVKLDVIAPGSARGVAVSFPVTGGSADPRTAAGTIRHRGGLRFRAGGKSLTLRNFTVRVGEQSVLTARVGGARVPIFRLSTRRAKVNARALTTRVRVVDAFLTQAAASALNQTFGTSMFARQMRIGTARSTLRFGEAVFSGGATTLRLDKGAADALQSLGITPSPIDPAAVRGGGIAFPITGGKVDAKTLAGSITHSGGLALTRGDTRVELRSFTIGIDDTPALSALVGEDRVDILNLDASKVKVSVGGRFVTVSGVVASLTAGAAQALNQAFSTDAFKEGLVLGTATGRGRTP